MILDVGQFPIRQAVRLCLQFYECRRKQTIGVSHYAKWEKVAIAPEKCILEQNSKLQIPIKFGSLVFRVSTETENWCWPLWKMGKMAVAP